MSYVELWSSALFGFLVVALVGAFGRYLNWRRGAPANVAVLRGLLSVPKRYLVNVHEVVSRQPDKARMHVAAAGGFVASLLLVLVGLALAGEPQVVLESLLGVALMVMLLGAILVIRRRYPNQSSTLSGGGFHRLGLALAALSIGWALTTFVSAQWTHPASDVLGVVSVLLIVWGLLETVLSMGWGGVMKHALAGTAHLAFHPRPARFDSKINATGLELLALDAPKLGIEKPRDFAWNELLGFDACVQCGRCESVCPAFAAGQPLNPKKLIQDLVVGMTGPGTDAGYTGSPHPGQAAHPASGGPNAPIVPGLIADDTLWACTTCRACVHECPMMIEHVDAIVGMRRFVTLETGDLPHRAAELLDDLRHTDNTGGHAPERRSDWAVDLNLPLMSEIKRTQLLFWVGDGAFDPRIQVTLRALVKLLRLAEVDFAILGDEELDCGDVARRLGEESVFQALAERNIETLGRYQFERILTADPHALHCLRNEYGALGGNYEVIHHTTLLAELVESSTLKPTGQSAMKLTYHDPCYLARYNAEMRAPRTVLHSLGAQMTEMQRSGVQSRCCGGGGGAPITDVAGERRIADMRMNDVRETEANVVAVACPNCLVMLEGVVAPRPRVADVAELLLEAVETRGEATDG